MSTFIQLILEVTDGDDLAFAGAKRDDAVRVQVKDETVNAKLHSFGYIPGEALE